MDRELRDRWCANLRSGDFKQGRSKLSHGGRFCCIGVLARTIDPKAKFGLGATIVNGVEVGDSGSFHPNFTKEVGIKNQHLELMYMNDTDKKTFAEIADWIEVNL